ncbi:MAG: hypothetical protein LBL90_04320 [Prevotellaceae bacterium]|jgi:nitrogen fixation/metabolism regulation signal transduction histidine kinase|nr:hypothetical protein [Prevotellaceae bacterium]
MKSFKIRVIGHIAGIVLVSLLLAYVLIMKFYIGSIFLLGVLTVQIVMLFQMINSVNRQLAVFIDSLFYGSFNSSYRGNTVPLFRQLDESVRQAGIRFHKLLYENEEERQYLQAILKNIDIGVMVYDTGGEVQMINRAASKFFHKTSFCHLSELDNINPAIARNLLELKAGETIILALTDDDDELLHLSVQGIEFHVKDKSLMLVSLKNIYTALEEKETEAWQKLISVLSHEIMNSITPIVSLADMVANTVKINKTEAGIKLDTETSAETEQALQTINRRSNGLLHFVGEYRSLTRVPLPNFQLVDVVTLIGNIIRLFEDDFRKKQICLNWQIPAHLQLFIDPRLIEQVLINLLKNASESLAGRMNGEIGIRVFYNNRNRPCIEVTDNGQGILPDVLDKIFVPFFTTKAKGSGIGLSLSRQIMYKHQGKITVRSQYGKGSVFTLQF